LVREEYLGNTTCARVYPACPEHSEKEKPSSSLLDIEEEGLEFSLTSSYAMYPLLHPCRRFLLWKIKTSKYFWTWENRADQVERFTRIAKESTLSRKQSDYFHLIFGLLPLNLYLARKLTYENN